MVLQQLKLPIRPAGGRRNVQDYRLGALWVCMSVCECVRTHSISPDTVAPERPDTHTHTHTASPDNSANPQLPTVKPSILQPADRRIFSISTIYITFIQFHVTHSHPSRSERPCRRLRADCCVSCSSCCWALTIRPTKELSQGDPSSKSLVRH